MDIPKFDTDKELFDFLIANKETLIAQKKSEIKNADAILFASESSVATKEIANKEEGTTSTVEDPDKLKVKAVINTTNLIDSHRDMHVPGIWTKTLKENKSILHLQEHNRGFSSIIAAMAQKTLKASAQYFQWTALGFPFEGKTQALVFDSIVEKQRNEFMFNQYKNGYVSQHSVGMRYTKILMAINNEDYKEEFANWEKYAPKVANKEILEGIKYFWPVLEAQVVEGSAVTLGSNYATPTLSVESKDEDSQPPQGTDKTFSEILEDTRFFEPSSNANKLIKELKLF